MANRLHRAALGLAISCGACGGTGGARALHLETPVDRATPEGVEVTRPRDAAGLYVASYDRLRDSVPAVTAALYDADPAVRVSAAAWLAWFVDIWAVRDDASDVVRSLAAGLGRRGDDEQVARLTALRRAGPSSNAAAAAVSTILATASPAVLSAACGYVIEIGPAGSPCAGPLARRLVAESGDGATYDVLTQTLTACGPPDERDVHRVAAMLAAPSQRRRESILSLLASWHDASAVVIDAVVARLSDRDAAVRSAARRALVAIPGGALRGAQALFDEAPPQGEAIDLDELRGAGTRFAEILPWLRATAEQGSTQRRLDALCALADAPPEFLGDVRPVLRRAVASDEAEVRAAAACLLFRFDPPPEDAPARAEGARIAPFLGDPAPEVRAAAGDALLAVGVAPLGVPGIRDYVATLAPRVAGGAWAGWEMDQARRHVRSLGTSAAPPLLSLARDDDPRVRRVALDLVGEVGAPRGASEIAPSLADPDAIVRAKAARAAGASLRVGADASVLIPALAARLDDPADAVRAAAFHALAGAAGVPEDVMARARRALDDSDAAVRVAAAEAAFALAGDIEAPLHVLRATLDAPSPSWGWIGRGGVPAPTEDDWDEPGHVWAAAARALARMGPSAATAAETVAWAALRHGEPRMQRILVEAVTAMGPAAAPAGPLLERLAWTRSGWIGFQETVQELDDALAAALRASGRELPTRRRPHD